MKVGVPTEIKEDEYRVAVTPAGARELAERGHQVLLQAGAGEGSALDDEAYTAQGATIVPDAAAVFEQAEMVLKVKEPQPPEVEMLRPGVNVAGGNVTHPAVAEAVGTECVPVEQALKTSADGTKTTLPVEFSARRPPQPAEASD